MFPARSRRILSAAAAFAGLATAQVPAVFQAEKPGPKRFWTFVLPLVLDVDRDGYQDILAVGVDSTNKLTLNTFGNQQGKDWTLSRMLMPSPSFGPIGWPLVAHVNPGADLDILIDRGDDSVWYIPDFPSAGAPSVQASDIRRASSLDRKTARWSWCYGQSYSGYFGWSVGTDPQTGEELGPRLYSIYPIASVDSVSFAARQGKMTRPIVADFNMDGRQDLVAIRGYATQMDTCLFRRSGPNGYENVPFPGFPIWGGAHSVGDYDNDGDLDIVTSGMTTRGAAFGNINVRAFYEYQDGSFTLAGTDREAPANGAALLFDVDNDGDLDMYSIGTYVAEQLYRNQSARKNAPPSAPSGLSLKVTPDSIQFNWQRATDDHTPSAGLTYNLRIGTAPGVGDILDAFADAATGRLLTPHFGNAWEDTALAWVIGPTSSAPWKPGTYYWTVQAIDNAYAASAFAPVQAFIVGAGGTVSLADARAAKPRSAGKQRVKPGRRSGAVALDGRRGP